MKQIVYISVLKSSKKSSFPPSQKTHELYWFNILADYVTACATITVNCTPLMYDCIWSLFSRRLSENALFPELCVILKKLSSEYQLYTCGNFFSYALILKKIAILGQPPSE